MVYRKDSIRWWVRVTFASVCSLEYSSFSWICQAACFFSFNRAWWVRNAAWIFDADLSARMTSHSVVDVAYVFVAIIDTCQWKELLSTWPCGELGHHSHFICSIRNGSHLRNDLNRSETRKSPIWSSTNREKESMSSLVPRFVFSWRVI